MPHITETCEGPFWIWDQDHLGQVLTSGAFWDGHLKPFMDEALSPTRDVLDVGASIGWFTVYLAQRARRTLAVEAHPLTFDLLTRNIALHGLAERVWTSNRVAFSQGAQPFRVGDYAMFGLPDCSNMDATSAASSIPFVPLAEGEEAEAVQTICLDTILAGWDVSLIKVDVQGCDLHALIGLEETIRRCRPRILFEFEGAPSNYHGHSLPAYEAFFAKLPRYGKPRRIREDIWDYVVDPHN